MDTVAQLPPGFKSLPQPLASWSFSDTNNWTSDQGYAPISFTNIGCSNLGNGHSLVVNTNGAPAFLNYYIFEATNNASNLVLSASGSITFWYAPDWSGGTNGGTGPGQQAQLIDVGEYTYGSSYGYWGLSVDASGSNIVFQSQDGLGNTYGLSAPISWTTNNFHFIALTYSSTNVSLYLDGLLAANDPGGLNVWPSLVVQTNGIFFGSDTNGSEQANGMFNSIQTYTNVLASNVVQQIYGAQKNIYFINPFDIPFLLSGPSIPSYTNGYEAVTGQGSLILVSNVASCVNGSSVYDVWLTNIVANMTSNGMSVMFTIEGGEPGYPYDVFANSVLHTRTNGIPWAWEGQGYQCNRYMLTNMPNMDCFIILGTPWASNPSGLTDAYELLVLQISPTGPQFDSYGVPYAWYAQHGLTTLTNGLATADPDQDALLNYQEYFYGTDPQHSEGFNIWVSTPNGTSSIP
jgi:hypothetical protein